MIYVTLVIYLLSIVLSNIKKNWSYVRHPGKIQFIKNNLSPLIRNISFDYRINLWMILIRPLFTPIALFSQFLCNSSRTTLERKLKKSLKWFLGIGKTTPDDLLFSLVDIDFQEWARIENVRAEMKWESRLSKREVSNLPKYQLKVNFKWLSKEFATYINAQNSLCRKCDVKRILRSSHLLEHGVPVPEPLTLVKKIGFV